MIDIQVPIRLAYRFLKSELQSYRMLTTIVDDKKIYTLIHLQDMIPDENGKLVANVVQVEIPDKDIDDVSKWFKVVEKTQEGSEFYDIELPEDTESEDSVRRMNVLLLVLDTIIDTAKVTIKKDYDTELSIN